MPGESDAEYVARQMRLREEAAARMRAKFGGSGGLNGRMGGVGSSGGCGGSSGSGASTGEVLAGIGSAAGSAASVAASGLGTVAATGFSATSWLVGKARESAGTVVSSVVARSSSGQHLGTNAESAEEESNDISDLLASVRVDHEPARASTPSAFGAEPAVRTGAVGSSKAKRDVDFFAAAGFDAPAAASPSPSPSVTRENTPTSSLDSMGMGKGMGKGMGMALGGEREELSMSSPSTHVSNHASTPSSNGLSARKKVVAKKQGGGDAAGWDDFDTW